MYASGLCYMRLVLICSLDLTEKSQLDKAEAILIRLRGHEAGKQELLEIREAIALEHAVQTGWGSMFRKSDQCLRYRSLLNWAVNILQQVLFLLRIILRLTPSTDS